MEIISFNGKTYNSLDEMPADQRAAYEQIMDFMQDKNNNGIPDLFEGDVFQKMIGMASTTSVINGQEVQSIDSLPPETRAKFEKSMVLLSRMGLLPKGMPSFSSSTTQAAPIATPAFKPSPPITQSSPSAISEDSGSRTGIIIAVVAVLLLCALAAAGGIVFLLMNQ
jgi:hypothetical protein